jgi:hypothetical protein
MNEDKHPLWAVAAALLLLEGGAWHYRALTRRVVESGLSNLGRRGGGTPANTLRTDISTRHGDIFDRSWCRAYYEIRDQATARRTLQVRRALAALAEPLIREHGSLLGSLIFEGPRMPTERAAKCERRLGELEALLHRAGGLGMPAPGAMLTAFA